MIERPPIITDQDLAAVMLDKSKRPDEKLSALIDRINDDYEYWDTVKYKKLPESCSSAKDLWLRVKASRISATVFTWDKYCLSFGLTNKMQRLCHEFDMNFGGSWENTSVIPNDNRERYLVSSLMEEAIYSSQMEGAATTRKVAKDMLRRQISPKDKSQQMIVNNYQTIRFIVENKQTPLTPELVLHIHHLMTENTLNDSKDAGRLRMNNEVVVEDGITHEVVHTPPSFEELPTFLKELCKYFNETNARVFVHPIIRGIIIHFMVAYMHPFIDGNGRTARALFYWYMLKENYKLTEYMSISRVISKSKASYEKAFRYTENDGNDMGYFVAYNLKALEISFQQLREYIQRKQQEKKAANTFMIAGNINYRQAMVLQRLTEEPDAILTVRDVQEQFSVSSMTARKDLTDLVQQGYLTEVAINKVTRGYIKMQEG